MSGGDFPGSPVIRTPSAGLVPVWGTKIPYTLRSKKKNNKS